MTDTETKSARAAADETWRRTRLGFSQFVETITPWLLELGGWIFGALIAFNLVILGVVLTIGPVDIAIKTATAAFALALPPNVAGFVLLRLVSDMVKVRVQVAASKAFQDAGLNIDEVMPDAQQAEQRLRRVTLRYTYSLLALTVALTLVGVTAALWHSAWWIGVGFLVMLAASQAVMFSAISQLGGGRGDRWEPATKKAEAVDRRRTSSPS